MTDELLIQKIKLFLANNRLCVVSTIDDAGSKPESAVVAFAEKDDLSLIFGTSNKSRKYKNLQTNKNVSFVVGWSNETGTLQYDGIASELSQDEAKEHGEMMALKNKQSEKFILKEGQRYFIVKPSWIRLLDVSPETKGVHEISF